MLICAIRFQVSISRPMMSLESLTIAPVCIHVCSSQRASILR